MRARFSLPCVLVAGLGTLTAAQGADPPYSNFEASHVHPLALTPAKDKLLAVNTPDALLEVFRVMPDGSLAASAAIPVGLEPVSVVARTNTEAWVANHLSDSVSIVDLTRGTTVKTLAVGDEPSDIAFAGGKAFVAVSQEDAVEVYDLSALDQPPIVIKLMSRDVRALAVSRDGSQVYAVTLRSGNQTTVINANNAHRDLSGFGLDPARLAALGLNDIRCDTTVNPIPPYPPLPAGVVRNPLLIDPADGIPRVGLIVKWDETAREWKDDAGQNWNQCLPYRLPDHDLFVIDVATLAVATVDHLGTSLFDVSVNPASGKIYIPHTEARNEVRFEHAKGVRGHIVDNRIAIVDPGNGNAVANVDLNTHINRASDPLTNLAEREASVSQPGMMAWKGDGTIGYLTAIGSRKLFVVDPACTSGACIFGPSRATPRAVVVGEGPTGVVLFEPKDRAYVLNRFSNSLAVVDTMTLQKIADVPLHDPSGSVIQTGRRFLYDGVLSSAHGDASCATCHISGDLDGLAWDLGDPTGDLTPYADAFDNVRFIFPVGGLPTPCDPAVCASHAGFDPQKGPMTTQTFRGMLEPLHWRGDRPTFNEFNPAFVGLLGAADKGPVNGKPAGLSPAEMESLRQFTLGIQFPPNPYRNLDDTLPAVAVTVGDSGFAGNPSAGLVLFDTGSVDAGQPCQSCHAHPFGAAGGQLGGVTPSEPTAAPAASALFSGNSDVSPHNDLKVAHMRNLYEKQGPAFGAPSLPPPDAKTGFGYIHDGSVPTLLHFFSTSVFTLTAQQVKDVASFSLHFPTGTQPCVGQEVTVPEGPPPTASPTDEAKLVTLLSIADTASPSRHGELVATAIVGGRLRSYVFTGGRWQTDITGEPALLTDVLRTAAQGPLSFMCVPRGSGARLGGDRDLDTHRNGEDCAPADPKVWGVVPTVVTNLLAVKAPQTRITWDDQSVVTGPGLLYDVVGGKLTDLRAVGIDAASACVQPGVAVPSFADARPGPPANEGFYYVLRARNACGKGSYGPGLGGLDAIVCE